ncbi:MAG: hypothetical protein NTY12_02710 [Candidatus Falkowbacteria bacterium]|nr:hypothetical protein [Candidatus Falkowbacteria bacterium]
MTIKELNNKWWYRLVKVSYIAIFVLFSVIAITLSIEEVGNYQEDYTVKCNYGNKGTFLAAKDKNIYISSTYDYSNSLTDLPDYIKTDLQSACGISKNEISEILGYTDGFIPDDRLNSFEGKKLFELTKTKINITTHLDAILQALFSLFGICVGFEVIRRVFYYVVIGKIKPKE